MPVEPLKICGQYNLQRFKQFSPEDCANWYLNIVQDAKSPLVMYPAMGRKHISFLNENVLVFEAEPRGTFKSINYTYYVVNRSIYRIDKYYNQIEIANSSLASFHGEVYFTFLVAGTITFAVFVDGIHIYVYREDTDAFAIVTDTKAPAHPKYIATFGNRIVVSSNESSQFGISVSNLDGNSFNAATCFTIAGNAIFGQENGIIRQMGILHNTLYIFTDYTIGVWNNQSVSFTSISGNTSTFPFKKNSTYDWDFGIADASSLDIDFGRMVWIAQNRNGLLQCMVSSGDSPVRISTKAIDVLFQNDLEAGTLSPFLATDSFGFLYEYENTIFYRLSAGSTTVISDSSVEQSSQSVEYNFETKTWSRCIEYDGTRNRIKRHIYFDDKHLVTLDGDTTVYQMSGQYYVNEVSNPDRISPQDADAYIAYPMRYERITPIISQPDYSEFITEYVEIDFVWGESNIFFSDNPFANAVFIIGEQVGPDLEPVYLIDETPGPDSEPVYLITDTGNTPQINETHYNSLFKPHIELYFSDDGGISYHSADNMQFSQMGVYQWRMRWYQLGASRNRVYKLICVSPVPIVVLGGVMNRRRASGAAN